MFCIFPSVLFTVANELLYFCVVDAVTAFWQNHTSEFPSLNILQASMNYFRRCLMSQSLTADVDGTSVAVEQHDSSSAGSDDVK